jgi:hypothetical protein
LELEKLSVTSLQGNATCGFFPLEPFLPSFCVGVRQRRFRGKNESAMALQELETTKRDEM